jgi:hypothetical protein
MSPLQTASAGECLQPAAEKCMSAYTHSPLVRHSSTVSVQTAELGRQQYHTAPRDFCMLACPLCSRASDCVRSRLCPEGCIEYVFMHRVRHAACCLRCYASRLWPHLPVQVRCRLPCCYCCCCWLHQLLHLLQRKHLHATQQPPQGPVTDLTLLHSSQ